MTRPELVAAHTLYFSHEVVSRYFTVDLSDVSYAAIGPMRWLRRPAARSPGEKVRHGQVVERTVRRYRGRSDIRRYRAESATCAGDAGHRPRERRPGADSPHGQLVDHGVG